MAGSIATKYVALWQPVTIQVAQFRGNEAKFQSVFYMCTDAQAVVFGGGVIGSSVFLDKQSSPPLGFVNGDEAEVIVQRVATKRWFWMKRA